MLYIIRESDRQQKGCGWCWWVGDHKPDIHFNIYDIVDPVVEIRADGDELEHILTKFKNLVHTDELVQHWCGDIAKTIVRGL